MEDIKIHTHQPCKIETGCMKYNYVTLNIASDLSIEQEWQSDCIMQHSWSQASGFGPLSDLPPTLTIRMLINLFPHIFHTPLPPLLYVDKNLHFILFLVCISYSKIMLYLLVYLHFHHGFIPYILGFIFFYFISNFSDGFIVGPVVSIMVFTWLICIFKSGVLVAGGLKYQASETQRIFPCYNV